MPSGRLKAGEDVKKIILVIGVKVVFDLQSQAQTTTVTWTMTGPYPYINRVFGTIFNMDKMIGGSFDKGLADLKALAET